MQVQAITSYREKVAARPKVYVVIVTVDGEFGIDGLYDTKEAAERAAHAHNTMKGNGAGYYGKARVEWWPLLNAELAEERFDMSRR